MRRRTYLAGTLAALGGGAVAGQRHFGSGSPGSTRQAESIDQPAKTQQTDVPETTGSGEIDRLKSEVDRLKGEVDRLETKAAAHEQAADDLRESIESAALKRFELATGSFQAAENNIDKMSDHWDSGEWFFVVDAGVDALWQARAAQLRSLSLLESLLLRHEQQVDGVLLLDDCGRHAEGWFNWVAAHVRVAADNQRLEQVDNVSTSAPDVSAAEDQIAASTWHSVEEYESQVTWSW